MHVVDASVVLVDGAEHITACEGEVAGIEKQRDAGAGGGHEGIELRLGLDHGRHVVVVAERHALLRAPLAEGGDFPRIGPHLVVGESRLGRQRLRAVALDRAADFAIDDAGGTDRLEELDHRGDAVLVGGELLVDQRTREPAAAERHVGLLEDGEHHRRIVGEAAAFFHAGKAGGTGLPEALLEAHVVAELDEIVVPPRDRRHAQFGFHLGHLVLGMPRMRWLSATLIRPSATFSHQGRRRCGTISPQHPSPLVREGARRADEGERSTITAAAPSARPHTLSVPHSPSAEPRLRARPRPTSARRRRWRSAGRYR